MILNKNTIKQQNSNLVLNAILFLPNKYEVNKMRLKCLIENSLGTSYKAK